MTVLLALVWTAQAEPLALRHAGEGREVVLEGGSTDVVVGGWFLPQWGVAVDVGVRGQALGVHGGWRRTLVEGERGWGVAVFTALGARALLTEPGVSVHLTPAIAAGSLGPGIATLGLALPMALRLDRFDARLPALVELNLGGRVGPVAFGLRGALGSTLTPSGLPPINVQWSAWLTVALPDGDRAER